MADYYQVKNQNIFTPPANISLGNTSNQYSNVYVQNNLVVGNVTVTSSTIIAPRVTTITYPGNDTAADPAGGQTITLTGSGFVVSASILINSIAVSVVSVVSSTVITFTSPANSSGSYVIYVVNPDGSTAIAVPGIQYSGIPTWTTAAGTLGSLYETASFTESVVATGDAPITYSVASGTLPPGATFNGNGTITGTSQLTASPTTYTFIVSATDAEQQDTNRSFSLTINTDVVTWTTPAANSTTTLGQNVASTTTLLATSAAGKAITYTANTLPTGLSISGATVTGTPTVVGNTSSLFTATAATTGRTTTATINWAVTVSGDTYFPYTTLLLSGGTSTSTFIADASTNNFAVAIAGDTKPNNFNPYTPGYYSNYFDGTGDYLTVPSNAAFAFGTGDYTFECWINTNSTAQQVLFGSGGTGTNNFYFNFSPTSSFIGVGTQLAYVLQATSLSLLTGVWYHVAASRSSGTLKLFLNGAQVASGADSTTWIQGGSPAIGSNAASGQYTNGYISNLRVVNGVAVYTGTFTPPTAPLTATQSSGTNISAITGTATSLLTCQSNRFIDNSTNAFVVTKSGDTKVSPTIPFVPNTTYATYGSTYFDGTGDYLRVPYNAGFAMGSSNFTIEYWVYPTVLTGDITVLGAHTSDANGGYGVGFDGTTPRTWINFGSGWPQVTGPSALLNAWNHIALVRNGSSFYMYTNGVPGTVYTNAAAIVNASNSDVTIGARYNGTGNFYTGYATDARIVKGTAVYTTTFTPPSAPLTAITNTSLLTCQTNQPVNNSMFLDSSTNAFAVTRAGNTSAGTFTPYGANWSNYFDGTTDKLTLPSSSAFDLSGSTWTIEFWMYSLATPTAGNECRLLMAGSNGDAAGWDIAYNNNGTIAFFRPYGGSPIGISTPTSTIALNTWYHVAFVCNAGSARLYINGVAVAGPVTISLPTSASQALRIGYDDVGTVNFQYNGYLSNVRIVKGVAVYTGNFTVPTAPLSATQAVGTNISAITGTATSLLTCQSNRFVDNSTNAFAVTITGDVAVQRFSPFSPTAAYSTSTIGGSGYLSGASSTWLAVPINATFAFGTNNYTYEAWVYPTAFPNAYNTIFCNFRDDEGAKGWSLLITSTGLIHVNNQGTYNNSTNALSLNTWTHIAVCRVGNTVTRYINGVADPTTLTVTASITNVAAQGPTIGGSPEYSTTREWTGYISNARVISGTALYTSNFTPSTTPFTAVSGTSLLLNYTNAGVYDSTMINDLETVGDAKILSTQTPYAGSYYSNYFDGTGDYLSLPNNAALAFGTGDFTVETWIYPTNAGQFTIAVISNFQFFTYGNSLYFNDAVIPQVNGGTITTSAWQHVAISRSGTAVKGFINGSQVFSTTSSVNFTSSNNYIAFNAGSAYGQGYLSNFRILKGTALYTSAFTPPTSPLTAITNTSLLTCQSNRFLDNSTNAFTITQAGDTSVQSFNPFQRNSATTMSFDGTGDALTLPANNVFATGTRDFTIEGWIYVTDLSAVRTICGTRTPPNTTTGWNIAVLTNGNMQIYDNTGYAATGAGSVAVNTWCHFAFVRLNNVFYSYLNGIQKASSACTRDWTQNTFWVGATGGSSEPFLGYINDLRFTKDVARYTSTFTPPTSAFLTT